MKAEKSRQKMNDFNFKGLYECYDEKKGRYHEFGKDGSNAKLNVLKEINNNKIIEQYEALQDDLGKYSLERGIISNGNHGLDLLDIYKKIMNTEFNYTNWNETPIMFVYDSPADHLKDEEFIYGKEIYTTEELRKHKSDQKENIDPKFYLSTHLWRERDINRFKIGEKGENISPYAYVFFNEKAYGEFIVSLMLNFHLNNVYTTNLFRYQITSSTKNYYSLGQMRDIIKKNNGQVDFIKKVFEGVFLEEVETFQPKIIIATGSVYDYLEENKILIDKKIKSNEKIRLIRTIHPVFRISKEDRGCLNMCKLAKNLYDAKVIEEKKIKEVISTYFGLKLHI